MPSVKQSCAEQWRPRDSRPFGATADMFDYIYA